MFKVYSHGVRCEIPKFVSLISNAFTVPWLALHTRACPVFPCLVPSRPLAGINKVCTSAPSHQLLLAFRSRFKFPEKKNHTIHWIGNLSNGSVNLLLINSDQYFTPIEVIWLVFDIFQQPHPQALSFASFVEKGGKGKREWGQGWSFRTTADVKILLDSPWNLIIENNSFLNVEDFP